MKIFIRSVIKSMLRLGSCRFLNVVAIGALTVFPAVAEVPAPVCRVSAVGQLYREISPHLFVEYGLMQGGRQPIYVKEFSATAPASFLLIRCEGCGKLVRGNSIEVCEVESRELPADPHAVKVKPVAAGLEARPLLGP